MPPPAPDVELVRRAWSAVIDGGPEAVSAFLAPGARWYGAPEEGEGGGDEEDSGCHSRSDVLAFIRRASEDGVTAEVLDVKSVGARVVVIVQTTQPEEWGPQPGPHGEVVTVHEGRITEMVVYPDVDSAVAAASAVVGLRAPPFGGRG